MTSCTVTEVVKHICTLGRTVASPTLPAFLESLTHLDSTWLTSTICVASSWCRVTWCARFRLTPTLVWKVAHVEDNQNSPDMRIFKYIFVVLYQEAVWYIFVFLLCLLNALDTSNAPFLKFCTNAPLHKLYNFVVLLQPVVKVLNQSKIALTYITLAICLVLSIHSIRRHERWMRVKIKNISKSAKLVTQ